LLIGAPAMYSGPSMARGAPGLAIGLVLADVEQAIETQAGGDQACLAGCAKPREPLHCGPEFIRADVKFVDRAEQVGDYAIRDRTNPRITLRGLAAEDDVQQLRLVQFCHGDVSVWWVRAKE
jgi:hypothetical protein